MKFTKMHGCGNEVNTVEVDMGVPQLEASN